MAVCLAEKYNLAEKYKPNIQKSLFHKDKVRCIQNWIKKLKDDYTNIKSPSLKKILFIYGPISCGKTTLVDILLKGFNRIDINPEDLKINEHVQEIINGIRSFDSISIESMCKNNDKNKQKFNIVVIDNVELCDKYIKNFIDSIKTNIPIILISSNSINVKNLLPKEMPITFIEITKVTLMELSQMISYININEDLNLDEDTIKKIIEKSIFDVRQVFYILEQFRYKESASIFITDTIQEKHVDEDLVNKLNYIFSTEHEFNYSKTSLISSSDPQMISNGIFQNYIEVSDLDTAWKTMNNITLSDIMCKNIYTDQNWELFDIYSEIACVLPAYCIKSRREFQPENFVIKPFKDISYNYINSFHELKELTLKNVLNTILTKYTILKNVDDITIIFKHIISMIIKLNEYFDSNKKGKNTSKKEKFDLYTLLSSQSNTDIHVIILDKLATMIFTYRLFECDSFIEELKNISFPISLQVRTDFIDKNIDKLDLRILKRYINFTSINLNTIKLIKTHTETSIKLKLLELLFNEMENNYISKIENITNNNKNIEDCSISLSDLWNLN
jgi:hypothetical protein